MAVRLVGALGVEAGGRGAAGSPGLATGAGVAETVQERCYALALMLTGAGAITVPTPLVAWAGRVTCGWLARTAGPDVACWEASRLWPK